MVADLAITRGRVRKLIRVRELAASHKLEKMRRVRMLEKQAAWKREDGFDRIEVIAEMHEHTLRRLHASFDSEPLYTGLYNPRRPPTPEEFTLDMNVEVESLREEILLSQPLPPPEYDLSLRRSPAAGTGLDEPGVLHTKMKQTKQEKNFSFQADVDDFSHVNCTRIPKREGTSFFQADVGINPETTTTVKSPLARSLRDCRRAGNSEM